MKTSDYMEFREIENAGGTDADEQVYFLGRHVHTIKNTWTRPGGHVYTEREMCVVRAQQAVQLLWNQTGGTR
jgi:hypothetical protein